MKYWLTGSALSIFKSECVKNEPARHYNNEEAKFFTFISSIPSFRSEVELEKENKLERPLQLIFRLIFPSLALI